MSNIKEKKNIKILSAAFLLFVGCAAAKSNYIRKNMLDGEIVWRYEGGLVPYKYEKDWKKLDSSNIVQEVSCVSLAKEYAEKFVSMKKSGTAMSIAGASEEVLCLNISLQKGFPYSLLCFTPLLV